MEQFKIAKLMENLCHARVHARTHMRVYAGLDACLYVHLPNILYQFTLAGRQKFNKY